MKRKRYSVEQIVAAVKQHEMGLPAGDIARKLGIAEQTFYRWKKQYSSMAAWRPPRCGNSHNCGRRIPNSRSWWQNSAWTRRCCRRLRQKSGERTRAPGCGALSLRAVSDQRTACLSGGAGVAGDRAVPGPATIPTGPAATHSRPRHEPSPLWVQADPCVVEAGGPPGEPQAGASLVLYGKAAMTRPASATPRERGHRHPTRARPHAPNTAWSMDFVTDRTVAGHPFRTLAVIDVFTRECLAVEPGHPFGAAEVVRVLSALAATRGAPRRISCDNGSEFAGRLVDLWAYAHKVTLDFSRPGNPTCLFFLCLGLYISPR